MKFRTRKLALLSLLLVLVCSVVSVTAFAADGEEYVSNMYATFWGLVPPLIAIVLALITKEVYSSLFIGIIAGALFYSNFNPIGALDTIVSDGLIASLVEPWNGGIMLFLVLLGIIVALMNKAGGSAAFGRWAEKNVRTRSGAMFATFALGILIFIDDYFNCLTVGSVMRPLTDAHKISRAKLAYLIDATAAPVCMIAPISSWACAVASAVEGTAVDGQISGFNLFVQAIPYNFYSILTFVFIIGLIIMKMDYGPMRIHEMNAMLNGDLYTTEGRPYASIDADTPSKNGRVIDLVLPIALLIILSVVGLLYTGGMFDGSGTGFFAAFENCDASVGLPWAALISLILSIVYFMCRRVISFKDAMKCLPQGFIAMVPAILILTFALTLKNITGLLGAAEYVRVVMESSAAGLSFFLPAVIFLVACGLAFSTGTSWGTFSILVPIVVAIFPFGSELLTISISACLAGAVCGDHCSPISDTTIMSSTGAQCDHVNHVSTQLPYAITVAGVSFVCYIISGFVQNIWICLPLGIALMIATLFVIKAVLSKKYAK
ncbi:MAG: Na+/H+ antiporter NhaC family protein [Oscillospiraceae bacterium]